MNFIGTKKALPQGKVSAPCRNTYFRQSGSILCSFVLATVIAVCFAVNASASIIINAPMTDTNSTGWILGGNPSSAVLTGNGAIDPAGQGWLRLTNATGNQTGFAYNTTTFDLSAGLLIEFDYATWGGNGADGYSVYLFDGGASPFNIGAFGGSLGYAQKLSTAACSPVNPSVPGISGGYVGIGVDEFGNFAYGCEGRYNGTSQRPNTVTIRGSVVGFGGGAIGQTSNTNSYPWIATSANNGSLWYNGSPRPSQTGVSYRKVRIQISPAPNPVANVWVAFGYGSPLVYTQMITNQALPAISTAQKLMIGYAASTGGSTNYHEIRNLLVSNQNTTTAIDLAITKTFLDVTSGSTTTASAGDTVRYTVIASNTGPNNVTATGVGIQDTVPAAITGVAWTCAGSGGATCGAASGSGNNINTTANLPRYGYVTYTITGTVSAPAPSLLSNTASLVIPGSITDYNSNNDSVTVNIPVNSNLSTSTKTWTDTNGGDQNPGDVIPYTITLNETGGAAVSGVSVTDTFQATLTNLSVISCPAGATCTIVGQVLTASNILVPANGTAAIVVSTTIAGGAAIGTLINNTATITNPAGTGATPAAPAITVSQSQVPVTGLKQLYLYGAGGGAPGPISRSISGNNSTITIGAATSSQIWAQDVAMQLPMTLDPNSNNVPVNLYMSCTNGRTGNVRVNLTCGAISLTQTKSIAFAAGGTVYLQTFNLPYSPPQTCAQGNKWTLTITNTGISRALTVYPINGGNRSYVDLPSATVINVNSVTAYSTAYPLVTIPASFTTGTVYLRAVVSDPFGSFDINASNNATTQPMITVKDPGNVTVINAVAMPQVADSGVATKTFEYAFPLTAPAPSGNWTVSVTAPEGTEGTVSHTGVGTFNVSLLPSLMVVKSSSVISDPINGVSASAKAIPGAEVQYTIQVINNGSGVADADSIAITDVIPANMTMYVDTAGSAVTFSCSGCGLTTPWTYANAVSYSYQPGGGPPYVYPPTTIGYDPLVKGVRIKPSGTLNGGGASFTVKFKVSIN